ncbi:type IV secretory system conjugative DNA transfer family protein [Dyadobacter sp. CY323]|uniref:type IV secretory system conjugative DNA transfer family protein n=1 Tax=Dyadobacter sp. CY323 TaxID=2907302 RepID=UPI001F4441F2|nr:type IV secretory system conjugative DNA transfer family protein [Dyadobacter sp. CY323]MCE6989018.1 type IV secretory system conjugative DNA transfer family protein [Dyadobacter sp. CY323]
MYHFIFVLCAAFFGYNFYHTIKGTLPRYIEVMVFNLRKRGTIKDYLERNDSPIGSFTKTYGLLNMLTLFVILIYFIGWSTLSNNIWLFGIASFGSLGVAILMNRNLGKWINYYTGEFSHEEKKVEIKKAYGVKGWANPEQLRRALGDVETDTSFHLHIGSGFYWKNQGHIMTIGGSRGGKGVNLILPALLNDGIEEPDASSFVILDPKGENLAVAGNYLRKSGYDVLAVNPFLIPEISSFGNARFNPFDLFSGNDPDFDKYADMISYALIPPTTHSNDYFDQAARGYISLYIRHMMTQNVEPKNFRTLYKWLRLAGSERTGLLLQMSKNESFDGDVKDEATAIFGQLVNDGGKTVESIYSTVRNATDVFKDLQLRESVSGSDLDIKTIAHRKTAIFVCLSPSDLERCQTWLRLFFGSVMRGLTKYYNPARKVVLLMDEFPTLGTLKEFEQGAGFLAGYNVTLWPVMQDLTQLKNLYPNSWETFVNNAIIRHYLAIGDNFTADYISKRMPSDIRFVGNNADGSPREIQKPLLEPSEVMSFPDIILEVKGMDRPTHLSKVPYWEINSNASPNPFRS